MLTQRVTGFDLDLLDPRGSRGSPHVLQPFWHCQCISTLLRSHKVQHFVELFVKIDETKTNGKISECHISCIQYFVKILAKQKGRQFESLFVSCLGLFIHLVDL